MKDTSNIKDKTQENLPRPRLRNIIFLIDDDLPFGELIQETLGDLGEVFVFQDPTVFLRELDHKKPDLVLVDLHLEHPKYNGFDLVRHIKARPDSHLIPVLMISGADDVYGEALESGIEDYIQKPILPALFLQKVRHVLRQNREKIHTNALTGLPGIQLIEHEFSERSYRKKPFALAYMDMDHFKAFNDEKGVKAGDAAIQRLAGILLGFKGVYSQEELFSGHLGGDDFFLLGKTDIVRKVIPEIYERFQKDTLALFSFGEVRQKHYYGRSREGQPLRIPLLSLSTVILNFNSTYLLKNSLTFDKISETASSLKKEAKSEPGNSIIEKNISEIV